MESQPSRLFVYGTLMPGQCNAHELAGLNGHWQKARVRGILHEHCWGLAAGYPCLALDPKAGWVSGFLLTDDTLPDHWERLDVFEGAGYLRVVTEVICETGECVTAHLYVVNPDQPVD